MSSSKNSLSRIINSGKETIGNIGKTRAVFMAAVLNALVWCNNWSDGDSWIDNTDNTVQKINAQLGSVSKNVVEIEITDQQGTTNIIPQSQFTKSYINSLPEWDFSYSVVLDWYKTKIQWLDSNKVKILSQYANEITDYIAKNKLSSDGIRKFLKEISFPDVNNDNAIDEQDVTLPLPSTYTAPQFLKDYSNLLNQGATEEEKTQLIKTEFTQKNIVSTIETSDNTTWEIVVILKASAPNRVIRYEVISSETPAVARALMSAYSQSSQNLIQWEEVRLQPGQKVIYSEYDPVLNVESAKKEIINESAKPQLQVSSFDLLEDTNIKWKLETQYTAVSNFTVTDTPTKGSFTLNSDGTFEYAPWAEQYGTDTAEVSFTSAEKTYTTQIQFNIEAVNDIPESKNINLGTLEFGQQRTLNVNDIAQDKDGDSLDILVASTTNGAGVSLNHDGTITFTADTEGTWQIIVMVTDNKSDAVSVAIDYNVKNNGIDKTALSTAITNYKNAYDNGSILYTPSTYAPFKTAYEWAVNTLNNNKATEADVTNALNSLEYAQSSLITLADKSDLNEAINFAELVSDLTYTAPSFANMTNALNQAKSVNANGDATSNEVLNITNLLNDSIDNLVLRATSTTINALNTEINIVKALDSNSYTTESFTILSSALSAAESGIVDHEQKLLSDSEAKTLKDNLTSAKNSLVFKNRAPSATSIWNITLNEGESINVNLKNNFNDLDGDTLTFSQNWLPSGLILNPSTWILSGTVNEVSSDQSYTVTITASDWELSTSEVFTVFVNNVNKAPTVSSIPDQTVNEWDQINIALSNYFTDPDNQNLVFSTNLGTITNGVFTFNAPEVGSNSSESVTITASDWAASISETFIININDVNKAPTGTNISNASWIEGTSFNKDISGNFSDLDNDTLTFTANGLPSTLNINPNTGIISGNLPAVDLTTPYTVTVIASDSNLSTSKTFTLTVNHINQAPTPKYDFVSPNVNEGTTLRYDLNALFDDQDSNLTFTIDETEATIEWNELVFVAPNVEFNTPYFFTVHASDGEYSATNYLDVTVKSVISSAPTETPLLKENNFFYSVTTSTDPDTWNPINVTKKYYNGDQNTFLAWDHIENSNDYEYSLNNGTWVSLNNSESLKISDLNLSNGDYTLKVRAKNDLWNGPESLTTSFTVDTTHYANLISDVLFHKCVSTVQDGIDYLDCNVVYSVLDAVNLHKYNIQLDYAGKNSNFDTSTTQKNFLFPIDELTPGELLKITIKTYSHNGKLSFTNSVQFQYTGNE